MVPGFPIGSEVHWMTKLAGAQMTRPTPRTVPMLTQVAKKDAVLAERGSEYEYVGNNRTRKYISYAAGVLGVIIMVFGYSMVVRAEELPPVDVGMVVGGFLLILPMAHSLLSDGFWVVHAGPMGSSRLRSATFVLDGGVERAAEVYKISAAHEPKGTFV